MAMKRKAAKGRSRRRNPRKGKLTGAEKAAFLKRMKLGRAKAATRKGRSSTKKRGARKGKSCPKGCAPKSAKRSASKKSTAKKSTAKKPRSTKRGTSKKSAVKKPKTAASRSRAAKKGAKTREANAAKRSRAGKKGAKTRKGGRPKGKQFGGKKLSEKEFLERMAAGKAAKAGKRRGKKGKGRPKSKKNKGRPKSKKGFVIMTPTSRQIPAAVVTMPRMGRNTQFVRVTPTPTSHQLPTSRDVVIVTPESRQLSAPARTNPSRTSFAALSKKVVSINSRLHKVEKRVTKLGTASLGHARMRKIMSGR